MVALLDAFPIRTASVVVSLGPVPATLTIIAATLLGRQLKEVHDLSNIGRDIRLIGAVMLGSFRKQDQDVAMCLKLSVHERTMGRSITGKLTRISILSDFFYFGNESVRSTAQ